MKYAYKALLFMLCVNMSVYLNRAMGFDYRGTTALSPVEVAEQFDPTAQRIGWGGWYTTIAIVGDIVAGLEMTWRTIQTFVIGFPQMLYDLGAPTEIVVVMYALWSFNWSVFVWEFISGRIITRD